MYRLTRHSINSIDAFLESDDLADASVDATKQNLNTTIDEIIERKGSTATGREDALLRYNRFLKIHHFEDVVSSRVDAILAALSKSIKAESSSKETVLALKAVSLTALSSENTMLYETMASLLKRTVSDSQDNPSKAAAIDCLGVCLAFGGADGEEISENCTFLLEIIQSDGSFVGADDNAEVVVAALHTYSLLLTYLDDLEDESEDAIEALLEQLDSGDVNVQIAAGEAIALLFEKSYTPREEDEDDEDEEHEEEHTVGDRNLVKRYNAYHNPSEVLDKVNSLAHLNTRNLHRSDKKRLHQSFSRIATTIENPRLGLRNNAESKMIVRVHADGEFKVDQWWKLVRLNALRRALMGGFINHHFEGNEQVLNALPMLVDQARRSRKSPTKSRDKFRDSRKFVGAED